MFGEKKHHVPADARNMRLCYLGESGYQCQDTREYKELTRDPKFVCRHCGRKAHREQNLCRPVDIA